MAVDGHRHQELMAQLDKLQGSGVEGERGAGGGGAGGVWEREGGGGRGSEYWAL